MVTTLNFKDVIDLPKWRPLAPPSATVNLGNVAIASDYRNNEDRHPYIFLAQGTVNFLEYNTKSDEWVQLSSQGTSGNVTCTFLMPAQGPRGTIAAGATASSFTLTTALPASVGINQLANRGDGRGFKVRIIGNSAGSSGKTEERYIVGNTSGTTPTITVDTPFSFIPANGDDYEFLSGRVFILCSTAAAGHWKYYDILTNSFSINLATLNLSCSNIDNNLVGLDELFVPYNKNPGEGFLGTLTATGSGAASLTGQAAGGDASVLVNEYRNFQIRIVEDTATPQAAGQRRNITSHTAGVSPVYTVSAWTTQPSANAKYVIENNGDRIINWAYNSTNTSTYTISTNTWDSNITFAARPTQPLQGMMTHQAFSIVPDPSKNARTSFIFSFRGGNTSFLEVFDIAGAATGTWTSAVPYGNSSTNIAFASGSFSTQDPATNEGIYIYINRGISILTQRFYRFDMKNRVLEPQTYLRIPLYTGSIANFAMRLLAYSVFVDGSTKLSFIFLKTQTVSNTDIFLSLAISN